jgi:hypothetical protein
MPKLVEADRRVDLGVFAGRKHSALLFARTPFSAEHWLAAAAAVDELAKERLALVGEHDVPRIPRLSRPDMERTAITIEIFAA